MLEQLQPTNEALAIIGVVSIAIVAMFALGSEAKDIALAVGGGLVGYISKGVSKA